jgi:RHS repeat-associated protein
MAMRSFMTESVACASRYAGKERDAESGLDYFGARYYASSMGRWMSLDWADKPEAVPYSQLDNPQSLNLYGYVNNNPLSKADPDGHCPYCAVVDQVLTEAEESPAGQTIINAVGATVTAAFAIGSGLASDTLSSARPPAGYVPGGSLTDGKGNSIFISKGAGASAATGDKANTGPKAADAPTVTASGQAANATGEKRGPSGKAQGNSTRHNTEKGAKEAAARESKDGTARKDANPKDGRGGHYHPNDTDRSASDHHYYPNNK